MLRPLQEKSERFGQDGKSPDYLATRDGLLGHQDFSYTHSPAGKSVSDPRLGPGSRQLLGCGLSQQEKIQEGDQGEDAI